ncbi:flagellar assembly protein FliW [uncultured Clostridium sp.]|uniref:flagellar assembly protein FliW n=1 Tax=uncultured Clostridium sp. TaxID=59620 RepID=UPI0025ED61F8|nr:flagellar assembly protein FliW [uncultured Clostridium sp.]
MSGFTDIFEKEINFKTGILGLEEYKKYKIKKIEGNDSFYLLQSCEDTQLAMVVMNPFQFIEDYEITLDDAVVKNLNIKDEREVIVFNTVTLANEEKDFTTNLVAPFIINVKNNCAEQIILNNSKYKIKEKIFKE